MTDDALKLTAYFGERQRFDRFFADEVLDLFSAHRVATSALLRGISGFGLRHHLRTDRSLTLSEDPPVVAIAVDVPGRIEPLAQQVARIQKRGILTVERTRLLHGPADRLVLPHEADQSVKLTIYIGRYTRVGRTPAFMAVCDLMHQRGIAGASVFVGVDGTAHGERQRARFFDRNLDVPAMIVAVGSGSSIEQVVPELNELLPRSLITIERVQICKRDGNLLEQPRSLPSTDRQGLDLWQKLMIYSSEADLYQGRPIHREAVRCIRESGSARGATVLRGMWGFHGDHEPHGDKFLQWGRRVPVATIVIDSPGNIAKTFKIVDELTQEHGLVTVETVPALLSCEEPRER